MTPPAGRRAVLLLTAALLSTPAVARPAPALRLQAGAAASGGAAVCADPATSICPSWYQLAAVPAVLSAQVDLPWSHALQISPGLAWTFGPWLGGVRSVVAPSVDLGFLRGDRDRQARLTLGLEVPIDDHGQVGLGGRVGLGATTLGGPWPGLAFDVSAGVSEVAGRTTGSLRLLVGVQLGGDPRPGPVPAEEPRPGDVGASPGEPQVPAPYRSAQQGLTFGARYASTRLLDGAVLDFGVSSLALEAPLDGPWLTRWDLEAAVQGGLEVVAPAAWLAGMEAGVTGELGHRLLVQAWSPYVMVGGRLHTGVFKTWMVQEDDGWIRHSLASLEVAPRFGLGVSFLDARRSFRAVVFARAAWWLTNASGDASATSLGLSIAYDLADRLSILAEVALVTRPLLHTPSLALVDLREQRTAALSVRKVFRSGSWLGLDLGLARESDQLRYLDSGLAISTSNPSGFIAAVRYGMHLGD